MTGKQPPMTRDEAEGLVWLLILVVCVICIIAAIVCAVRRDWYGLAGVYVLAAASWWYTLRFSRACKRRNPFDRGGKL